VSDLVAGLLGALLATNQPVAVSNLVQQTTGISVSVPDPNDPVEKEYQKLLGDDDEAQAEVDQWIRENQDFASKGGGVPREDLNRRIHARFEPVGKAYRDFLQRHPDHARAHIAYGSFLGDIGDDEGATQQWEKALALDPKNPAVYDDLAGMYAHDGPVKKAFEYYAKAIELKPTEPLYYKNLGTIVYLFRKDAVEYYNITEQQVFDKALDLYNKAMKLDPTDFPLASYVAQTYYGIKPPRTDDALNAWTNALKIAHDDIEREGVYIHFARLKLHAHRFDEARAHLDAITNAMYADLKKRLVRSLEEEKAMVYATNHPAQPSSPPAK